MTAYSILGYRVEESQPQVADAIGLVRLTINTWDDTDTVSYIPDPEDTPPSLEDVTFIEGSYAVYFDQTNISELAVVENEIDADIEVF